MAGEGNLKKKAVDSIEHVYPELGLISIIGIIVLLGLITLAYGFSYQETMATIWSVFVHGPSSVSLGDSMDILDTVINVIGIDLIILVLGLIVYFVISKTMGKAKSFVYEDLEKIFNKGSWVLFGLAFFEEYFARWLFFGVYWPLLGKSDLAFWILFLIGNGAFAILHLTKYKELNKWSLLRVLPQFTIGIAFTYIFLQWGFWFAVLAHFYFNVVVFSSFKEQKPGIAEAFNLGYYVVLGVILAVLMQLNGLSLTDFSPWLHGTQIAPLAGYSFFDYAISLLMVNSIIVVVGELLLLDHTRANKETSKKVLQVPLPGVLIALLLFLGVFFGLNWFLSFFTDEPIMRALAITIMLALIGKPTSGSALARSTMISFPSMFLMVTTYLTMGFWFAFGLALVFYVSRYLPSYVRAHV